ncbi:hypothetical protein [Couchioplanes caeruleus]|uniref:Uncharacterized protein n=1 Tax=Couchioplanes caeruleus subsp. caeruleus TaxID=56427 RepID=A0A1K0FCH4_9ACTN|nr:hypothetical protein [Couchioplanes caeruleus]OJF10533.1 hypothetical protein BG844_31455 [Couchioplanes caeruleus subsp. caeruleus]
MRSSSRRSAQLGTLLEIAAPAPARGVPVIIESLPRRLPAGAADEVVVAHDDASPAAAGGDR